MGNSSSGQGSSKVSPEIDKTRQQIQAVEHKLADPPHNIYGTVLAKFKRNKQAELEALRDYLSRCEASQFRTWENVAAKFAEVNPVEPEGTYELLTLTKTLLDDNAFLSLWSDDGGIKRLTTRLETEFFGHFAGSPALQTMLAAIREFPDFADWASVDCDAKAMIERTFRPEPNYRRGKRGAK